MLRAITMPGPDEDLWIRLAVSTGSASLVSDGGFRTDTGVAGEIRNRGASIVRYDYGYGSSMVEW